MNPYAQYAPNSHQSSQFGQSQEMDSGPRMPVLKLLLAGDAQTGKTSLARWLGGEMQHTSPEHTVGCDISSLLDKLPANPTNSPGGRYGNRDVQIDLWDVGGAREYGMVRSLFSGMYDGVVLVYDASRMESYDHLLTWLFWLTSTSEAPSRLYWDDNLLKATSTWEPDVEDAGGNGGQVLLSGRCPLLVIANKSDLVGHVPRPTHTPQPEPGPSLIERMLGTAQRRPIWRQRWRTPAGEKLMGDCQKLLSSAQFFATSIINSDFNHQKWLEFLQSCMAAKMGHYQVVDPAG